LTCKQALAGCNHATGKKMDPDRRGRITAVFIQNLLGGVTHLKNK